jgi:hypothetical protein
MNSYDDYDSDFSYVAISKIISNKNEINLMFIVDINLKAFYKLSNNNSKEFYDDIVYGLMDDIYSKINHSNDGDFINTFLKNENQTLCEDLQFKFYSFYILVYFFLLLISFYFIFLEFFKK